MMPEVTAQAYAAAQKAMSLRDKVSPAERDYIEALAKRYADPAPEDRSALDRAFAEAMRDVAAKYPADPDAPTLYADSLMNLSPVELLESRRQRRMRTPNVIVDTLESVLRRHPDHIGALHLHIHAVEAVDGKRAEVSADRLLKLAPAAGHLVHMPSHIYMRVGRYADAYDTNALADAADDRYVAQCNAQGIYPLFYHRHNQHFQTWAAMFQGRSADSLEAGRKISQGLEPAMIAGPFSETLQHLMSQPLYVMVRFGRWDEILKEPQPVAEYGLMNAIWHYARGMAYRYTGKIGPAKQELRPCSRSRDSAGMKDKLVGFAPAPAVLAIAADILGAPRSPRLAAIATRAIARARRARCGCRTDSSTTSRPTGTSRCATTSAPSCSTRAARARRKRSTGRTSRATRATATRCSACRKPPEAQGKTAEAARAAEQFSAAWQAADVKLSSSRF